jgi:hypothetical protein
VKALIATFESDWTSTNAKKAPAGQNEPDTPEDKPAAGSAKKAVQQLTKKMDPLAVSVKKAVRIAVAKAGDDMLSDKGVKHTMKKVVKQAVKEAVKEAVQDAKDAQDVKEAKS